MADLLRYPRYHGMNPSERPDVETTPMHDVNAMWYATLLVLIEKLKAIAQEKGVTVDLNPDEPVTWGTFNQAYAQVIGKPEGEEWDRLQQETFYEVNRVSVEDVRKPQPPPVIDEAYIQRLRDVAIHAGYPTNRVSDYYLDLLEPGMTRADVEATFQVLVENTPPLQENAPVRDFSMSREQQRALTFAVFKIFGIDQMPDYPPAEKFIEGERDNASYGMTRAHRKYETELQRGKVLAEEDIDEVMSGNRVELTFPYNNWTDRICSSFHEIGHVINQTANPASHPLWTEHFLTSLETHSTLWETLATRREFWTHLLGTRDYPQGELHRLVNENGEPQFPELQQVTGDDVMDLLQGRLKTKSESDPRSKQIWMIEDITMMWNTKMKLLDGDATLDEVRADLASKLNTSPDDERVDGHLRYIMTKERGPDYLVARAVAAQLFEHGLKTDPNLAKALAEHRYDRIIDWHQTTFGETYHTVNYRDLVRAMTGEEFSVEPLRRQRMEQNLPHSFPQGTAPTQGRTPTTPKVEY